MKAVVQAAWLLTIAFGNLIVIIVAETKSRSLDQVIIILWLQLRPRYLITFGPSIFDLIERWSELQMIFIWFVLLLWFCLTTSFSGQQCDFMKFVRKYENETFVTIIFSENNIYLIVMNSFHIETMIDKIVSYCV